MLSAALGALRCTRRLHARFAKPIQHEPIDGVANPAVRSRFPGWFRAAARIPSASPRRAFRDPSAERRDLRRRQRRVPHGGRRHATGLVSSIDTADQLAFRRARHGRSRSRTGQRGERTVLGIEPQRRHPRCLVRAVAGVAAVRQNRPHFRIEVDRAARSAAAEPSNDERNCAQTLAGHRSTL